MLLTIFSNHLSTQLVQCGKFVPDRWTKAGNYMVGSGQFVSTRTGNPASFLAANQNLSIIGSDDIHISS